MYWLHPMNAGLRKCTVHVRLGVVCRYSEALHLVGYIEHVKHCSGFSVGTYLTALKSTASRIPHTPCAIISYYRACCMICLPLLSPSENISRIYTHTASHPPP